MARKAAKNIVSLTVRKRQGQSMARATEANDLIHKLGGSEIVATLLAGSFGESLTSRSVRLWRESCPENRLVQLRKLAGINHAPESGSEATSDPTENASVELPEASKTVIYQTPVVPIPVKSVKATLAEADERRARKVLDLAERAAPGCRPSMPCPGYWARLCALAAIDLPGLGSTFGYVADMSVIMGIGSAIGMIAALMVGAHSAGPALRHYGERFPRAVPALVLAMIVSCIIGLIMAAMVIRSFGVDAGLAEVAAASFSYDAIPAVASGGGALEAPEALKDSLVAMTSLVTATSVLFALLWSYQRHSPQAALALAVRDYRRASIALERALGCK